MACLLPAVFPALLLILLVPQAVEAVSSDTLAVCSALYSEYPDQLVWDPLGPKGIATILNASVYNTANTEYWNAKSSSNRAACTFFPSNAEDVSFAVQTLNNYSAVGFALKCAGHNPNLGFSSVDGGVLIAFRPNSQYATPSADLQTVDVGAGAKWEDVYAVLQPFNKAVVGGRLGDIGVIGFTTGGGLSYLSSQYGLACDNVVNFECVLADGTITNANATSNPDLYFVLRGGGNQFAIVTKMTLKTHDIGDAGTVWGGTRAYTGDKHSAILAAVSNFTANNEDTKAALIPTFNFLGVVGINIPAIVVFFFYDAASPAGGIFDAFDAIEELSDDAKARTYEDLTQIDLAGKVEGLRFQIRENTFPNMPLANMSAFLDEHFDMLETATAAGALSDFLDLRIFTTAIQPMTHLITRASSASGGNALGLSPETGDRLWIEYDLAWLSSACDSNCPAYLEEVATSLHNLHAQNYSGIYPTNYESGDLSYISYNPLFMNDAMYDQPVLQSYGEATYQKLKSTHAKYDPEGFFSQRQKGFTFTT
ncbi:FAD-binding, type 2 [Pleurostoma richardsiae]|uniref:FAD-binding, type 2 n=1 Tax=Pleurostoma richardsiae TaxID=41990 RepID=A0AA38VTC7_9PEZI|nr:FAD-binding, type 2 [Pleurostoma richardsiae]